MSRTGLSAAVAVVMAAAVAGCGATGGASASAQIKLSVTDFVTAIAHDDPAIACGLLTSGGQVDLLDSVGDVATTCVKVVKVLAGDLSTPAKRRAAAKVTVNHVKVTADTATVMVSIGGSGHESARLALSGGKWLISDPPI